MHRGADPFNTILAAELRAARGRSGRRVPDQAIADYVGIERETANRYFRGKRNMTGSFFAGACHLLDIDPAEVVAAACAKWDGG